MTLMKDPGAKLRESGLQMDPAAGSTKYYPGTKYYWVIDGKPIEIESGSPFGMFDVYHCAGGMVVILKVAEQKKILGSLAAKAPSPNFRYMEITRFGLSTITYYGAAEVYAP